MKTQTTTSSTRSAEVSAERSEASQSVRGTKRVSARFVGNAPQARVELPSCERGDLRAAILELLQRTTASMYSVEVARELKCSVSRAVHYLRRLERDGELVSTRELSPVSGHGRRVYRRSTPNLPARALFLERAISRGRFTAARGLANRTDHDRMVKPFSLLAQPQSDAQTKPLKGSLIVTTILNGGPR